MEFPENDLKAGKEILENLKTEKTEQKKQLENDLKEVDLENIAAEKNRLKTELEKSREARSFSERNLEQKQKQLDLKKEKPARCVDQKNILILNIFPTLKTILRLKFQQKL